MTLRGPYVNEEGDVWFERGSPWPAVRRQASAHARETVCSNAVAVYEGIQQDVRISDEHDADGIHGDDDGCADAQGVSSQDPAFAPCCRTVEAYHFRVEER